MMEIQTKFGIGDTVWYIHRVKERIDTTCGFCAGEGRVTGHDGSTTSCHRCRGTGVLTEWGRYIYTIHDASPMMVAQVRYEHSADHTEEKYMSHETGCPSGSLLDAELLFATEREAHEYIATHEAAQAVAVSSEESE